MLLEAGRSCSSEHQVKRLERRFHYVASSYQEFGRLLLAEENLVECQRRRDKVQP